MWSLSFNGSVRWSKILNNCLLLKQPIIAQISRVKVYSSAFSNFVNETFILREAKIKFVNYTMEKDIYWIWNILILPFDVLTHFLCSCTSSFRYFVEICQRKITDTAKKYEKKILAYFITLGARFTPRIVRPDWLPAGLSRFSHLSIMDYSR